jgi:hypothetical protein
MRLLSNLWDSKSISRSMGPTQDHLASYGTKNQDLTVLGHIDENSGQVCGPLVKSLFLAIAPRNTYLHFVEIVKFLRSTLGLAAYPEGSYVCPPFLPPKWQLGSPPL